MTTLAEILTDTSAGLALAAAIPGPVGDVAKILAAAAGIAAKLAGDGRTAAEIVAHIERADDIGPKVAAGDVAAEAVVEERFPHAPGSPAGNDGLPEPEGGASHRGAPLVFRPGPLGFYYPDPDTTVDELLAAAARRHCG